jgi:hypothetical protein
MQSMGMDALFVNTPGEPLVGGPLSYRLHIARFV